MKYGHAIEHAAENRVLALTVASVLMGIFSAAAAVLGMEVRSRWKDG